MTLTSTRRSGRWWTELPAPDDDDDADPAPVPRGISLAAVVAPLDPHGRVLLTRRAPHMRTFPGCWVWPLLADGGGAIILDDDPPCWPP
jgi:8-oxo-dGTP pyrophosphatase MutT (NUDIX family)